MIEVRCSQCGLTILVPPTVQGKRGVCFKCGRPLEVPSAASARQRSLHFAAGDTVDDRYAIEERLGRGGMGVVYRAHDTLIDETVALKFMKPELLRTEKGQQLFIREAQVCRRLRHENIVAVHDVGWTRDGILYISMEYAEGQSLRAYLRTHRIERRLLDVRLAVTYLKQILAALEYAHRTVIHRDMKPENVVLLTGERVKVLDFGLAKAVHEELFTAEKPTDKDDKDKGVVGTLAYAAPEQQRREPVDLRADVFAVGLIMYELFTLRTPIDEWVPVPKVREDVSPSLQAVLDKALRPEREARWASAGEFRRALEDAFEKSYLRRAVAIAVGERESPASTEGMVYLEGGHFLMGNNAVREEAPEEEVYVAPFWMDAYPVTVAQYTEFLEATGTPEPKLWRHPQFNGPHQPVIGLSWAEANAYARWAGKQLPTEAQWEFAARGKQDRPYPWGHLPPDTTRSNFKEYLGMTSNVAMHEDGRSPDGIYDLAGNVYEWTADPFIPYRAARTNPEAAAKAPRRALRGGCWQSPPQELRCAARKGLFPEAQLDTVGFRCILPA